MKVAPAPCPARHFSPISSSARCQVVPRGARVPSRMRATSCAAARTGSAARKAANRVLMAASVGEKTVGAGAQPARAPLVDEIGEADLADAQSLLDQRVELRAALRGNADRLGISEERRK